VRRGVWNGSGDAGRYSRSFGSSAPFASPPFGEGRADRVTAAIARNFEIRSHNLVTASFGSRLAANRMPSSSSLLESLFNCAPLLVDVASRNRLPRSSIPIASVAQISFDPMEMRVHPRRLGRRVVLHELMRAVPVAGCHQSERPERPCRIFFPCHPPTSLPRRRGVGKRVASAGDEGLQIARDAVARGGGQAEGCVLGAQGNSVSAGSVPLSIAGREPSAWRSRADATAPPLISQSAIEIARLFEIAGVRDIWDPP
jgi:hypothetical protein